MFLSFSVCSLRVMELCDDNEGRIFSVCLLLRHTFLFSERKHLMNKKLLIPLVALIVVLVVVLAVVIAQNNNPNSPNSQCIHQWIEADCLYPKTCRICSQTQGAALGHQFTDATCTSPKTCQICQAKEGVAKGHEFVDATCTSPKKCQTCQLTEGSALGHTEVIDDAVSPTCTTKGLTEGKHCSACDKILVQQIEIDKKEHTFTSIIVAPTCTEDGYTIHSCICGENYKDNKTDALGHSWLGASCTKPKTCSVCNEEIYSPIGHSYSEKVIKATCTESGYTIYTCRTCGDSFISNHTNPTGHTEVIDPAIEPTTTSTGLTKGSHCSTCNTVLTEQVVIPKKPSPSESSSFQIKKNDILRTYSSLYDYNEYSIDYVEIDKKDTSDTEFQITVTIGAVMLLIPEDVDYVPDYIKGYWELVKDGETIAWNIFTISSVEELEYREISFTCRNLEAGEYTLRFTSYI